MRADRTAVVVCAMVCMGMAMPAGAQRIGIIAGGTFSELSGLDNVTAKNRTGAMAGVSLTLPVAGSMALQPELQFINKGSKLEVGSLLRKDVRIDYVEVPLLLRFDRPLTPAFGPHLLLGPSLGYEVGQEVKCNVTLVLSGAPQSSSTCADQTFKPKSLDWGVVVGAGVDLKLGGFGFTTGARYEVGLADISRDDGATIEQRVRNRTLTVYGGVLFGKL